MELAARGAVMRECARDPTPGARALAVRGLAQLAWSLWVTTATQAAEAEEQEGGKALEKTRGSSADGIASGCKSSSTQSSSNESVQCAVTGAGVPHLVGHSVPCLCA